MANQLEQVLKKTQAVYKQAAEELAKKLADFQARFAAKDKEKQALLAAGEITKEQYKSWLAGQVFQGKQWEAKAAEAAKTMVHANEEAAAIVNDGCMTAYAAAMNYGTYELEKATALKTGFTLYNRETVSRLLGKDPQLLPKWKIDQPKDYIWNYEKVKNAIIQGIIQGKPIPQIGEDLTSKLQTLNENKMRMFARTGMTGAHNAGRMDALHRAEDKGIKVKKKWLATNDDRTRDAHADLDGQIQDINDPFESELGDIMYPGDPSADPANVYNCRCTMVYIYPELEEAPEGTEPAPEYEQMTFDQWVEAKENQESVQGETKPETVASEDAREPEPEIMAEAEELDQQAPEIETAPEEELEQIVEEQQGPDELSDDTKQAIDDYIEGRGNKFTEEQVEEIKEKMTTTDEPLYRVEDMSWMAEHLETGDTFEFDKPLKSFTQDMDGVATIIGEGEDAGMYEEGPVVIFETVSPTEQYDVSGMSRNHAEEKESLVCGTFRVVDEHDGPTIAGRDTWIMQIEQVRPEETAAETETSAINSDKYNIRTRDIGGGEFTKQEKDELLALAGGDKLGLNDDSTIRMTAGTKEDGIKIETEKVELSIKAQDDMVIIDDFTVTDTGKGTWTEIFSEIATEAEKQGFSEIKLYAAGDAEDARNGYYTWPRLGFDGELTESQAKLAKENGFDATRVSDLMKTPEGRAYWKENGSGIDMTFDLTHGSYSQRTLEEYDRKRKGR